MCRTDLIGCSHSGVWLPLVAHRSSWVTETWWIIEQFSYISLISSRCWISLRILCAGISFWSESWRTGYPSVIYFSKGVFVRKNFSCFLLDRSTKQNKHFLHFNFCESLWFLPFFLRSKEPHFGHFFYLPQCSSLRVYLVLPVSSPIYPDISTWEDVNLIAAIGTKPILENYRVTRQTSRFL